ncbi:MAG: hypothetical protein AAB393_09005 [Bacteroidota bacterium]
MPRTLDSIIRVGSPILWGRKKLDATMKLGRLFLRASFILFSSLCLLVFQLGNSILIGNSRAYAFQPFSTVVPVQPTFPPAIGEVEPIPTPLPTVGPGQFFEEEDPDRPMYLRIVKGDEQFGYGPMNDEQTLYLMWFTDSNGTHYRVVDNTSQLLFGTVDPITGERRTDGFDMRIQDRQTLLPELAALNNQVEGEGRAADVSFSVSFLFLGVGFGICIVASAGVCAIATPLFGAAALSLAGVGGVLNSVDEINASEQRDTKIGQVKRVESDLAQIFTFAEPPLPDN